ncbi:MAG: sigma-54-dependent Fis family transcriptional regulator [bacterium TMED46]|nr:MAG: sigma-54-dependent Fis family transcriptional regulator [bacterium TMED46]|tara:strand:+ start:1441 stop:2664 length:1224 start_codon:yes stop_codon:yes gene_type:complete
MKNLNRLQKQSGIIGTSDGISQVLEMISQVAPVDISVLITGESGTGKEIVAKAIHKSSKRYNDSLVVVNCGAIPEGIIESELFGHKKGSFTGAGSDRKGYFEEANKGTIFLDEIGETPLETQVKLLRVLESGEFMRVGEAKTRRTDVRVIAATNKNLSELVKNNQFRQDLYFRLKTVNIHIPALRERVEDIGPFIERFALEFTRSNDIAYRGFMPDAVRIMKQYEWPGNVRELKHFVEKVLVLERGERITAQMVEKELIDLMPLSSNHNPALPVVINNPSDRAEIDLILRQLFMLKQDTELIQNMLLNNNNHHSPDATSYPNENSLEHGISLPQKSMEIVEDGYRFIRDDAIGDMLLKDLEKEAIKRTLKYFNNNRRKAARSLGMSERTLYRKIEEFGIEPKIKKSK